LANKGKNKQDGNKELLARSTRVLRVGALTFLLTIILTLASDSVLNFLGLSMAVLILFLIIGTGILFDIIGVAVTATGEASFHAMAAKRVHGASHAIRLVRHADRVSSFCNDLVGDICGTVSGAAAASIVFNLAVRGLITDQSLASLVIVGLAAALTVGGKAAGKYLALYRCREITFQVGRLLAWLEEKFGIRLLAEKGKMRRR